MALSQGLYQRQLQKLSPQQIQLMKLLQVPTAHLEERIKEEMEENPALETGEEEEAEEFENEQQKNLKQRKMNMNWMEARMNMKILTSVNMCMMEMMILQIIKCGMRITRSRMIIK